MVAPIWCHWEVWSLLQPHSLIDLLAKFREVSIRLPPRIGTVTARSGQSRRPNNNLGFNQTQYEEKEKPLVYRTSSYLPVKDRFVLHTSFNMNISLSLNAIPVT